MRLCAIVLGLLLAAAATAGAATPGEKGGIRVVTVAQAITPATTSYLRAVLDRARLSEATMLVIKLDTPGGLLDATRDIVQMMLASPIPIVVYIAPAGARGASAGTILAMAAHVAAMAPATHLGAAHPVSILGGSGDKVMGDKIVNDTVAFIESIAELRGRNVKWAISAVRESKSITADKALELKVIDLIAESVPDLVRKLDGRTIKMPENRSITLATAGSPVVVDDMSVSQSLMSIFSNPNLLFLLLIIAAVGLYIEMSNPGLLFPGVIGGIALLLALIAMQTLPVSYGALGLMGLGIALLVAEAFVPSFGVLGIGGIASLLIGSLFLLDESSTDLRISRPMIYGSVIAVGLFSLVIGRLLVKSFRLRPQSMQSNLVGRIVEVRDEIRPDKPGRVMLGGELWKAQADAILPAGERAQVKAVAGLILTVAPVNLAPEAPQSGASAGPTQGDAV